MTPPQATAAPGIFAQGHEEVHFVADAASGLQAIIGIFSTARGPALGGTRFRPYASEAEALDDVLKLSRAMAYKAAVTGLDLGGGKAVILGDPVRDKTPELLRAFGKAVEQLSGRYWTACDVGTFVPDMDVIAETCAYVTGRSPERGGAGDSAVLTAYGVHQAMRAAAQHVWDAPSLAGRRVGVEGVGKVGRILVDLLLTDGAEVAVSDVRPVTLDEVEVLPVDRLPGAQLDVYAPCALGGSLTAASVAGMQAQVVCGAANNQLAEPSLAGVLADRGVLYVPDYVANAGGLVQVADERHGFDPARARKRAGGIFETTLAVLSLAASQGVPPSSAADRLAELAMQA